MFEKVYKFINHRLLFYFVQYITSNMEVSEKFMHILLLT